MPISAEHRLMLEAMGLRLYTRVPVSPMLPVAPSTDNQAFWQTRLGQNIQRLANGRDLHALPVSPAVAKSLLKRMLWQKLRPLLKPE
jgi:hypothetical protein